MPYQRILFHEWFSFTYILDEEPGEAVLTVFDWDELTQHDDLGNARVGATPHSRRMLPVLCFPRDQQIGGRVLRCPSRFLPMPTNGSTSAPRELVCSHLLRENTSLPMKCSAHSVEYLRH